MRYADIDKCEICNGLDVGVSLFVQGCDRHCNNCFNPETWDFNGGKEWNDSSKALLYEYINKPFIKRITILGGEPLAYENLPNVFDIIVDIKNMYPDKKIWLYTGYTLNCGVNEQGQLIGDFSDADIGFDNALLRNHIIRKCDVVVDGEYIDELKNLSLPFKGSSNQRIIDVKKTIQAKQIILYKLNDK